MAARKIEKAANKPTNWLDIDKFMPVHEEVQDVDFGDWQAGIMEPETLDEREPKPVISTAPAEESGVSQSTINRFLNNEASISITNRRPWLSRSGAMPTSFAATR